MILRYKGYWVKINRKKWKSQNGKEKLHCIKEYFSEQTKYLIECIKNYWIGFVDIQTQDILCGRYGTDGPAHKELYTVSVICGRFGKSQWFSPIGKECVKKIVNSWELSDKKNFILHLDLGAGMSQRYTFSSKQKKMLIEKLKPLIEMQWYDGD